MKLLTKITGLFLLSFFMMAMADTIPDVTGIIAKDCLTGDTYDFDALLKAKHIIVQQTYSG